VGDVYRHVEAAAGGDFEQVEAPRLTALVHEGPFESLPKLPGCRHVGPLREVVAVTPEFGRKVRTGDDLRGCVEKNRPYLAAIPSSSSRAKGGRPLR
jgi:hypothetical protein